ncbi:hypothetical protein ACM7MN_10630 [Pseudomonas paraeruginosa]|uniref:hypothetical protein n=1 Tax=Pseudomonas paraeruginosa TaxID=2994495 RepID=UPI0039FCEB23
MDLIFNQFQTSKSIYAQDKYMTFAKSILHLPIFQSVKNSKKERVTIKIDKFYSYEDVEMDFIPLSVNFDFDVFYYILQKKLKSDKLTFTINMKHFMKFHKVHPSNKKVYIEKLRKSLKNMMKFYLEFRYDSITYKCHLLNNIAEDANDKENTVITFNKEFENFYKHDTDLIFNFKFDKFKEIEGDYARVLYMFYLTNHYADSVRFKISDILDRLQSNFSTKTKTYEYIKKAHEELIKIEFLKSVEPIKEGRELTGYLVEFEKVRKGFLPTVAEKPKSNTDELSICDEELPF